MGMLLNNLLVNNGLGSFICYKKYCSLLAHSCTFPEPCHVKKKKNSVFLFFHNNLLSNAAFIQCMLANTSILNSYWANELHQ